MCSSRQLLPQHRQKNSFPYPEVGHLLLLLPQRLSPSMVNFVLHPHKPSQAALLTAQSSLGGRLLSGFAVATTPMKLPPLLSR